VKNLTRFCHEELKINLDEDKINQFKSYQQELLEWNQKTNLTSITEPVQVEIKHFIDSLSCLKIIDSPRSNKIIDIGSGAGFPGIPIKIVYPNKDIILLEATQKKVDFCRHILNKFDLNPNAALVGRAEDIAHDVNQREKYDIAISRAVASLPALMELLLPFVKVGGTAIAMKGKDIQQELVSAERALQILGGRIELVQKIFLPILEEERNLIKISKINSTPEKYPRRPGLPVKKPLI
jgi:16S rRNA (guanine527-N7)-methyltransferase